MRRAALALAMLAAAGCSSQVQMASVVELPQPPALAIASHRVAEGENLHSIAWRYELDVRVLANHNELPPDAHLRIGQLLRLPPPRQGAQQRPAQESGPPPPATARHRPKPATPAATADTATAPPATAPPPASPPSWVWPVRGKLLQPWRSDSLTKGVLMAIKEGSPVVAAAGGKVVYAGSGLRGHGNLVIVRHDSEHLSAYGYNRRLRVREDDVVRAGQVLAESGRTPDRREALYFEVRHRGHPVDPMRYLQKPRGGR